MAFAFWYGGRLLADGQIDATQLWIVFIAVVSGGEAAAEFFASSNGEQHFIRPMNPYTGVS